MSIKVLSVPHVSQLGSGESGIHTVVRAYFRHGPEWGIEFVDPEAQDFDVLAIHAGTAGQYPTYGPIVAHTHGLYFTADYVMPRWAYNSNKNVIDSVRYAREVTVPSRWVAEIFERDMRFTPHVVPHGIDWERWQHNEEPADWVLAYAKNRAGVDVCNPAFLSTFARMFKNVKFVATFAPEDSPANVATTGTVPHDKMRRIVQKSRVYISTTKETWGIGILEAMASGTPVLAFAQGGAMEMVQHGVTGYLAQPNDLDDLAQGLAYCLKHRDVLSENSREVAKQFSWRAAMMELVRVYQIATVGVPPTTSVIIPCYNKEATLERAVLSTLEQTFPPESVVIVDDGSTDGSEAIGRRLAAEHGVVVYMRQENAGVAHARNAGIRSVDSKYICCLDADDWLDPQFLEACVPELEADSSLGIAYTGLHYHTPDGDEGLSHWPDEFDYDAQLERRNQIPTCCVFRREMWSRLGGYRQRYAPKGAGAEDGEFWLRAGAYGYNAKKVTTAGLFHYSWKSGIVTGDPDYTEVNYLTWHPWTRDGRHPFASMARPKNISHPVRQYDEPVVSVVIPVGPGHADLLVNALDSLEAQTFRKWEAIVVLDLGGPARDTIGTDTAALWESYPYVRWFWADEERNEPGPLGAGVARNIGVDQARGPFILYLDADDLLYPDAIDKMLRRYGETGDAVYTDYIGKAYVEDPSELAPNLQQGLLSHNPETLEAVIKHRSAPFDCDRAMRQPPEDDSEHPYIWCNITTLMPRSWHYEVGGFDEDMESWEDVLYWYKLAWSGKCFSRIDEELMVYRFTTGSRRDLGRNIWGPLLEKMRKVKKEFAGV